MNRNSVLSLFDLVQNYLRGILHVEWRINRQFTNANQFDFLRASSMK